MDRSPVLTGRPVWWRDLGPKDTRETSRGTRETSRHTRETTRGTRETSRDLRDRWRQTDESLFENQGDTTTHTLTE